jgi:hypothetical protein
MDDSCYLELDVSFSDAKNALDILNENEGMHAYELMSCADHGGRVATLCDDAAEGCDALVRLAETGIEFVGFHGAGDSFGPHAFAAHGGRIIYVEADRYGKLMVQVGDDGQPDAQKLQKAREFIAMRALVRDSFERKAKTARGTTFTKEI